MEKRMKRGLDRSRLYGHAELWSIRAGFFGCEFGQFRKVKSGPQTESAYIKPMRSWPFNLVKRSFSALLALSLVTVQGGLEPRHACPVHEPEVQQQADSAHGHAAHVSDSAPESSTTDAQHCCTCIGSCLVATPALLAGTATELEWLGLQSTAEAIVVHADALRHPLPRLLPFATAPPLS